MEKIKETFSFGMCAGAISDKVRYIKVASNFIKRAGLVTTDLAMGGIHRIIYKIGYLSGKIGSKLGLINFS